MQFLVCVGGCVTLNEFTFVSKQMIFPETGFQGTGAMTAATHEKGRISRQQDSSAVVHVHLSLFLDMQL